MPANYATDQIPDLPLSHYQVLRTGDFDRARDEIGRLFREHRAVLVGSHEDLDIRVHACPLSRIQLDYVSYNAEASLQVPPNEDFYALHFPHSGEHRMTYGDETAALSNAQASVASATRPLQFEFGRDFRQLILKINRAALERHLEVLTGVGVHRPVEFQISIDVSRGAGASLFRLIRFISDELDRNGAFIKEPLVVANLEDTLLTAVLTGLGSNYSARFQVSAAESTPRQVRAVETYIEANADEPITIAGLAEIAGVSAKSLFAAFRRHRGYSPMAFVKSCRLARAREALMTAAPGANVTRIALDSGFTCLGRFSVAYKQKFGESPSETLRRHR